MSESEANPDRKKGTLRWRIQESLLADIFSGRLSAGYPLLTEKLAIRFQVSHTPIREALIALAGIGVVDLLPNRTAAVRGISAKEVREVLQVRRALESEAARLACGRIDLDELEEISVHLVRLAESEQSEPSKLVALACEVDSRLHDLIFQSCGNRFLTNELNRLKILFRALRDASWARNEARQDYRRLLTEAHEHKEIIDALRTGNRKSAARAMAAHLRGGFRDWALDLPKLID